MNINEEYEWLKFFFDCYYNQSFEGNLDERFIDILDSEKEWVIEKLRHEILELEKVYTKIDSEKWNEIEALVHENSLRYLPYDFGEEFIRTAKRHLFYK
ncbi:hypothetical protein [Metabacillus indicus]|uniref:hypothetical protein n=1 Tax=Metabacillus indicus TaxID=246786 RepID=UPI0004939939|nr:hypothetical protein [Metabacillus indicus]KEZ49544.1 hypothetical protein AZ46_0213545 [Metabacillus indicus LMG 22858]